MQRELENFNIYEAEARDKQPEESFQETKMRSFMEDYYSNMKMEQGIDINYAVYDEDPAFDAMMKTLRPNTSAKTFEEFLKN